MRREPIALQFIEVFIIMMLAGAVAMFVYGCVEENAGIATSPVADDEEARAATTTPDAGPDAQGAVIIVCRPQDPSPDCQ